MAHLPDASHPLVTANLDLADLVAAEVRTRLLTREERHAAALYGLCLAAIDWPGTGSFRAFARIRCRWQVAVEIRSIRRRPASSLESDAEDPADPFGEVIIRDEADAIRPLLGRLTGRQREAFTRYCEGEPIAAIGARMGIAEGGADNLIRAAIRNLRKMIRVA